MKSDKIDMIAPLIAANYFKSFKHLIETAGKSSIAKATGKNVTRFSEILDHPDKLSIGDVYKMAAILKIEPQAVFSLIVEQLKVK